MFPTNISDELQLSQRVIDCPLLASYQITEIVTGPWHCQKHQIISQPAFLQRCM